MKTFPKATLVLALLAACTGPAADEDHDHAGEAPPPPTNRIDVPPAVRQNLGIEFARAERRRVAATLRLPGRFELLPDARTEHRASLTGIVAVRVEPLQRVGKGDVLCTIDSPEWRQRQRELGDLRTGLDLDAARIQALEPLLAAHQTHEQSLAAAIAVLAERIHNLEQVRADVGGQAAELANANVELARLRASAAEAAEQHTETETRLVELRAAIASGREKQRLALAAAAVLTGVPQEQLAEHWLEVDRIEVRAANAGLVDAVAVAAGAFVAVGDLLVTVTDPARVRFLAHAPQGDLARLAADMPARIEPPDGRGDAFAGPLQLGIALDADLRLAELFVRSDAPRAWARPGLSAVVAIETAASGPQDLAIPRRAVLRDGLHRVFFRRDTANTDQVVRVDADLGVDDGAWIVVKSGLADDDEVVTAGAYELVLASSPVAQKGGHFHADGTFHDGEHK
ncbi:MAG: efflux RND transporter periplasmic adaptor subunit [Planctomycetota bacterium]